MNLFKKLALCLFSSIFSIALSSAFVCAQSNINNSLDNQTNSNQNHSNDGYILGELNNPDDILDSIGEDNNSISPQNISSKIANIVIFIEFPDSLVDYFTPNLSYIVDDVYNNDDNSLKNYLSTISYGKIDINSSFYPKNSENQIISYVAPFPKSYYDNPSGRFRKEKQLLQGALDFVSQQILDDFPNTDDLDILLNDNMIDSVAFVTEIDTKSVAWGSLLWPHQATNDIIDLNLNGKKIANFYMVSTHSTDTPYNFISEDKTKLNYSTIIHETIHTLGMPDLYRYSGDGVPIFTWDVMAGNFFSHAQAINSYYTSQYLKYRAPLETISFDYSSTNTVNCTLQAAKYISPDEKTAILIESPISSNEIFMIEYRKKEGIDKDIPYSGLLIYRINPTLIPDGNANSIYGRDALYIFRPNEIYPGAGFGSITDAALSPSSTRNSLGKAISDDTSSFDNNTIHFLDGENSGIVIDNLAFGKDEDTLSFDIKFDNSPTQNHDINLSIDSTDYDNLTGDGLNISTDTIINTTINLDADIQANITIGASGTGADNVSFNCEQDVFSPSITLDYPTNQTFQIKLSDNFNGNLVYNIKIGDQVLTVEHSAKVIYQNNIDKTQLISTYNATKDTHPDDYTTLTYLLFKSSLDSSDLIIKDNNATQSQVDIAMLELQSYYNNLRKYNLIIVSDIILDGTIDISDAVVVLKYIVGLGELTVTQLINSDVNADNSVDILDVLLILKHIVGLDIV